MVKVTCMNYHNQQFSNEKRSMYIDRIFGISDVLNLDSEIIHIAVNILDLYIKEWNCPNIQVICICCLNIAIKFYSDNLRISYSILSKYISQCSPVQCFVKTEEAILIKINYKIPIITISTSILEFVNNLNLTTQYNRDIKFNIMYFMDYILFFPELYYKNRSSVLIVGITILSVYLIKKKQSLYNDIYPGISVYYKRRHKVLTSKRYINMFMYL